MGNTKNNEKISSNKEIIIQTPKIDYQKIDVTYPKQVPESYLAQGMIITLSVFVSLMTWKRSSSKDTSSSTDIDDMIIAMAMLLNISLHFLNKKTKYDTHHPRRLANIKAINGLRKDLYDSTLDTHKASTYTKFNQEKIYLSIDIFLIKLFTHFKLEISSLEGIFPKEKIFSKLEISLLESIFPQGKIFSIENELTSANKLAEIYRIIHTHINTILILILLRDIFNDQLEKNNKLEEINASSEPPFIVTAICQTQESFFAIYTVDSFTPLLLATRELSIPEMTCLFKLINQININGHSLKISRDDKENRISIYLQRQNATIQATLREKHKEENNKNTNFSIKNLPIQTCTPVVYCPLPTQPVQIPKQSTNDFLYEIKNDITNKTGLEIKTKKTNKKNDYNDHIKLSSCPASLFNNSNSLNKITADLVAVNQDIFLIVTHPNKPKKEYQIYPMSRYGNGEKSYFGFLTHKVKNEKNVKLKEDHFITALDSSIGAQIDNEVTREMKKTGHTIRINESSGKMHLVGREFEYNFKIQETGEEINLNIIDGLYYKRNESGTGCVIIKDDDLMKGKFRDQEYTLSIEIRPRACPEITTTIQPTMSLKM